MDDWYNLTSKDIKDYGGAIIAKYTSPPKLVMDTWSDYDWLPWKFIKAPAGFWDKHESQLQFLEYPLLFLTSYLVSLIPFLFI